MSGRLDGRLVDGVRGGERQAEVGGGRSAGGDGGRSSCKNPHRLAD